MIYSYGYSRDIKVINYSLNYSNQYEYKGIYIENLSELYL